MEETTTAGNGELRFASHIRTIRTFSRATMRTVTVTRPSGANCQERLQDIKQQVNSLTLDPSLFYCVLIP
jgi:hypothetical protein